MRLCVITSDEILDIPRVILKDGYLPTVAGCSLSDGIKKCDSSTWEYLEPALWFKVLLIQRLKIDCRFKIMSWEEKEKIIEQDDDYISLDLDNHDYLFVEMEKINLTNVSSLAPPSPNASGQKLNEDCVDFVNELEEVHDVLPIYIKSFQNNNLSKYDFCIKLIKLLHTNILPNIKVSTRHLSLLNQAFHLHGRFIQNLDNLIHNKTSKLFELKKSKKKQRQRMVNLFCEPFAKIRLIPELNQLIERDIREDLNASEHEFHSLEEDLKKFSREKKNLDLIFSCQSQLRILKVNLKKMKTALDKLKKEKQNKRVSEWFKKSIPSEEVQLQRIYLKMSETERTMQHEIHLVLDTKLLVSSVMEALKGTMNELSISLETYGVDLDCRNRVQFTNLLSQSSTAKPWKSLAELISCILSDDKQIITKIHFANQNQILEIINKTLHRFENQTLSNHLLSKLRDMKERGEVSSPIFKVEIKKIFSTGDLEKFGEVKETLLAKLERSKSLMNFYKYTKLKNCHLHEAMWPRNATTEASFVSYIEQEELFEFDYNFSYVIEAIENLKEIIPSFLSNTCKKIKTHLHDDFSLKKIWIIYESYFFDLVMDRLLMLYCAQFISKTRLFVQIVSHLSLNDLDLTDSPVVKLLLDERVAEEVINSCEDSFNSSFASLIENRNSSLMEMDLFGSNEFEEVKKRVFPSFLSPNSRLSSESSTEPLCLDSEDDSTRMKPTILKRFSRAFKLIEHSLKAKTPFQKVHHLSRCLREISSQVNKLSLEFSGSSLSVCNDDLLDAMVLLICNMENSRILENLYVQVNMLADTLSSVPEVGEMQFSLVTFISLLNHLQDKAFLKMNNRLYNRK